MLHFLLSLCFSSERLILGRNASSDDVLRKINQLLIASSRSRELLDRFWREIVRIEGDVPADLFEHLDTARDLVQQIDARLCMVETALNTKRGGGLDRADEILSEDFSINDSLEIIRASAGLSQQVESLSAEQAIVALEKVLISVHFQIQRYTPAKKQLRAAIAA